MLQEHSACCLCPCVLWLVRQEALSVQGADTAQSLNDLRAEPGQSITDPSLRSFVAWSI